MHALAPILVVASVFAVQSTQDKTSADTSGCGKRHNSGFNDNSKTHVVLSGDLNRTYAVRVPDGYNEDPDTPRKLIIDFHGRGGSPARQYNNSQYDLYDAGREYIAVYPAGIDEAWQGAPYAAEGVDDLHFVKDLLAQLRSQYCIDSSRIYASGKSNGGGFVDTLACSDEGDEFAAFAMAAAALYTDDDTTQASCTKKRAILEAHGDNDNTIPYGGNKTRGLPNIDHWVDWWGHRNECMDDDRDDQPGEGYVTTTFGCNGYNDVVKHYKIAGEGHCWPSTTGENTDGARDYCVGRTLDFTAEVLDFFGNWTLETAPCN